MRILRLIIISALLVASSLASASSKKEPIVTPPPPPETLLPQKGEVEPKVTILRRDWATIEEYSITGQVYAVKITPSVSPSLLSL